ncbi:MAG: hypothetical protein ACD_76C00045G0016 [uncultured bacterium]|nr:MAG: hypothetical protein ACD_76C00045G0016 [uncultured bacterium]HBD05224.1 hypothetical protein [Candidatus Uhrbacteria bacterium]
MESTFSKFLVIALLAVGESLSIYAEMVGAKNNHVAEQPFLQIFLKMFLLITLAGGFLIAGYMLGFKAFKNIWIVSVASITSILIVEPLLAWAIFQQIPTTGAAIGFVMGVVGLFLSIFF